MPPTEPEGANAKSAIRQEPPWQLFAGLSGLAGAVVLLYGAVVKDARVALIELLLGAAAFCGGLLIGFLFGIPRAGAPVRTDLPNADKRDAEESKNDAQEVAPQERPSTESKVGYQPSTNLEQIADWLTKIVIGVGLVEVREIGAALANAGKVVQCSLATAKDCTGAPPGSAIVAQLVIAVFAVLGFGLGYLWTRLQYGGLQVAADREAAEQALDRLASEVESQSEQVAKTNRIALAALGPRPQTERPAATATGARGPGEADANIPDEWPPQLAERVSQFLAAPVKWDSDPTAELFPEATSRTTHRKLSAEWALLPGDRVVVTVTVASTDGLLEGWVTFLLHPTFDPRMIRVRVDSSGTAEFSLAADGAFTVIAIADRGRTVLAYDLAKLPGVPRWFQ